MAAPEYACAKCGKTLPDGSTGSATIVVSQDLTPGDDLTPLLWCRDQVDKDGNVTTVGCGTKVLKGVNTAAWRAAHTDQAVKARAKRPRKTRAKTAPA